MSMMEEERREMGKAMRGGRKRKIALDKKREKASAVEVTFSKRRKTLFGKAEQLCKVLPQSSHPVSVAAIVFSPHGKPYVFGSGDDPDSVFDSFLLHHQPPITSVDDFIIRPPSPSSYDDDGSFPCCSGSSSGGTPSSASAVPMQTTMTGMEAQWLSLEGCDTLEKMVAKRDHLLTIQQLIERRLSDSSPPSSTTPPTPCVLPPPQMVVVSNPSDRGLMTCTGEDSPSQTHDSTATQEEHQDLPDDLWSRLLTLMDDDVYLDIDSFIY